MTNREENTLEEKTRKAEKETIKIQLYFYTKKNNYIEQLYEYKEI